MASSVVEICNMALAHVRASSINSLTEGSLQASQCSLFYETARNQCLSDADWGFNNSIISLAELSAIDVFGWAYTWQYPTNALRVSKLIRNIDNVTSDTSGSAVANRVNQEYYLTPDELPPVKFEVMNQSDTKIIVTNESMMRAKVRIPVSDVNFYTENFSLALSYLLGSLIAIALTGESAGRRSRTECLALYNAFLTEARDNSANQRHSPQAESEFIRIRQGG